MNVPYGIREQADRVVALLRHAMRFAFQGFILFTVGCAIALTVAMTRPREYRSEALILYRERVSASAVGRDELGDSSRRIGLRLRELVLSRSRLEKIIREEKLYADVIESRGMADAVELMRTKIAFKAREGDTYALTFDGNLPEQVQRVTQHLTDALVKENERSTMEQTTGTRDFLDAEAQRLEEELKKREAKLAKFLSEHPAFAMEAARAPMGTISGVAAADPRKASTSRRHSSNPQADAIEREIERIRARLSPSLPSAQTLSPEGKEAAEVWTRKRAEATRELEAAARDLNDKRQSLTDLHPDVKAAKTKVEAAERHVHAVQIESMREIARIQGRSQAQIQPLSAEERGRLETDLVRLQQDLNRAKSRRSDDDKDKDKEAPARASASDADQIVKLETTWVQLTREVADYQEQRRQVEAKRFTAEIRERLAQTEGGSRLVVIDPPYRPTKPSRGGRMQTAGIGGAFALGLALGFMVLRALLDDRVYDRFDMERLAIAPLLCTVPQADSATRKLERRAAAQADKEARQQATAPPKMEEAERGKGHV